MTVVPQQSAPTRSAYELVVVGVQGHRVSIRAAGDLGLSAEDELSQLLSSEITAGHAYVRMDLSGATHLGGCCLGALEHAHERCLSSHGLLLLEGIPHGLRQVFTVTGLERRLFLAPVPGPATWQPDLAEMSELVRLERARMS